MMPEISEILMPFSSKCQQASSSSFPLAMPILTGSWVSPCGYTYPSISMYPELQWTSYFFLSIKKCHRALCLCQRFSSTLWKRSLQERSMLVFSEKVPKNTLEEHHGKTEQCRHQAEQRQVSVLSAGDGLLGLCHQQRWRESRP